MKREQLQNLVRFLIKTLTRTEFIDLENIPASGGVIIAINHINYLDTPVIFVNPRRTDITALVTTKYQHNLFMKWFCENAHGIWINRDIADFTAIRKASKVLADGWALGIAPEGTRSKTASLQEGKPGTVMLAAKTRMPIVPWASPVPKTPSARFLRCSVPGSQCVLEKLSSSPSSNRANVRRI